MRETADQNGSTRRNPFVRANLSTAFCSRSRELWLHHARHLSGSYDICRSTFRIFYSRNFCSGHVCVNGRSVRNFSVAGRGKPTRLFPKPSALFPVSRAIFLSPGNGPEATGGHGGALPPPTNHFAPLGFHR